MKYYLLIISLEILNFILNTYAANTTDPRAVFLERLLDGYDPRMPPTIKSLGPTIVTVNIQVNSFDSVNEATMDYTVGVFFRQRWRDPRLEYGNKLNESSISLDARTLQHIWVPDSFFANEKRGSFHDVTVPNRLLRLYSDGRLLYSVRLSLTLSCQMKLQKFPMDTQRCGIKVESYAYTRDEIDFTWQPGDNAAVEVAEPLEIAQFKLKPPVKKGTCHAIYSTGSFSCINATFILERDIGFYMIQTFVPSILIVILSWVSFWINHESVPARISLGVLCVLTMTTQSSGARQSLPRVSYIKAIDVWMSTCLLFVFAALLEYAIVNVLARSNIKEKKPKAKTSNNGNTYSVEQNDVVIEPKAGKKKKDMTPFEKAKTADKISQKLFPATFILFNLVFWIIYFLLDESIFI